MQQPFFQQYLEPMTYSTIISIFLNVIFLSVCHGFQILLENWLLPFKPQVIKQRDFLKKPDSLNGDFINFNSIYSY